MLCLTILNDWSSRVQMTSQKKGTVLIQPKKVTATMSNGSMSKATMQLLHYQSLKVLNTNKSSNIQVCIILCRCM